MVWLPAPRAWVVRVAWKDPSRVPVPRLVTPSKNSTSPVGLPAPGPVTLTVAVKVTS